MNESVLASVKWSSTHEILISDKGKHTPSFSKEFPFQLRFYRFQYDHPLTPSFHDYLEVTYIFEGSGIFHIEGKAYEVKGGDVAVIGNTGFHRLEAKPQVPLKVICVFFMPDLIYKVGGNERDFGYLVPFFQYSPEFKNIIPSGKLNNGMFLEKIGAMYTELGEKKNYYQLAVKSALLDIMVLITRYYGSQAANLTAHNKRQDEILRLKNAFDFIEANYQTKVTLKAAAEQVFMSPSYFCKVFKKVTGCTLVEFILRLRIDKAKELLLIGEKSITEIAHEVGFDSHSYFDKIFHRMTRVAPYEYREKQQTR